MYYSIDGILYTPKDIEGKTFSEESKPEPLFTLQEMRDIAHYTKEGIKYYPDLLKEYFKQRFNITI